LLTILIFQEPGGWVARGLEHDITAQGRSLSSALEMLLGILSAHAEFDRRHNRVPLSAFGPAPQVYRNAYARATPLAIPPHRLGGAPRPARRIVAAAADVHPLRSPLPARTRTA